MGWGTDFTANVYLNRMSFEAIEDVRNKIDENINVINDAKQKIKMFVSSTPIGIIPDEWKEEPINWLNSEIDILFEIIDESIKENVILYQYVEYLENKSSL
jgi:hypothetical protein